MSQHWAKSSYSDPNGGNCVEARQSASDIVQVRDGKDPNGPVLTVSGQQWLHLLSRTTRSAAAA
jgi:hypothetical protein